MIELLSRAFIKNRENVSDPNVRQAYGMLCGGVGIALNVLLFAAKYIAGVLSASIAITADAFNNLSDAGSSLISMLGFKLSGMKPDPEHPFGHGRVELISGLLVALLIMFMGFDLAKTSITKIFTPEPTEFSWISAGILMASVLVKLYMALYNRNISRRISSVAMRATMTDSFSDACATFAVLISIFVAKLTGANIDAYTGTLVSLMILWGGFNAARDTISPLLGHPPDAELVKRIHEIVHEYPAIVGMHDLIVHDYGAGRLMISLHAEVPCDGDIMYLHDVIDSVEARLKDDLNCHAVIHMDPLATDDSLVGETKLMVQAAIHAEISPEISIHDFRMVPGPTHTNVIFDAVVPHKLALSDNDVKAKIIELVRNLDGNYFAIVTIDKQY